MTDKAKPTSPAEQSRRWRPDLLYSIGLLGAAAVVAALAAADAGLLARGHGWGTAAFFVAFGLFTISTGFPHPVFGHVSFDRVAQIASILVLGPIDAAWVNGLASLLYPWQRLRHGVPLPSVIMASCHNAGLMTFVVLGGGLLYERLGGPVPLASFDATAGLSLLALVIAMQVINDLGMMLILYVRRSDPWQVFNSFTALVEYTSAAAGIVLAIAFNAESKSYFALLLVVLAAGMLVIMQYALMRYRLEKIVEARTEELRVQAEKFERQATHDKLTGLPNRRHADDYLQQQIDLAQRSAQPGALALADIDHFKEINDEHSHAVGDRVLRRIARILGDGCRRTDFVARYGGEEFLLYFPDTSAERARQVCDQLRRAVQDAEWPEVASDLSVTISFGLAEIGDDSNSQTVLGSADVNLYRAKREGRNRVITG